MAIKSYKAQSRIEEDLWIQVKTKTIRCGLSISAIIRILLRMWVNGEIEIKA